MQKESQGQRRDRNQGDQGRIGQSLFIHYLKITLISLCPWGTLINVSPLDYVWSNVGIGDVAI